MDVGEFDIDTLFSVSGGLSERNPRSYKTYIEQSSTVLCDFNELDSRFVAN